MKSTLPVLALLALAALAWFLLGGSDAGPAAPLADPAAAQSPGASGELAAQDAAGRGERRVVDAGHTGALDLADDPVYQRALAGFRGRLVFTGGSPAADKVVRLHRIDAELVPVPPVFAADAQFAPRLEQHETRSAADGTFRIAGVWPQTFHLLIADAGGEHQRVQLVERTPGPAEVVDLGDIELPRLGRICGRVVDMHGEPAVGALVRAADVPGTLFDLAPVERFDPDGVLVVAEGGVHLVARMPGYVKDLFDMVPIPQTRTDASGAFRLCSVQPGQNVVVVNHAGHAPLLHKGVTVEPGAERDIGQLGLEEGEIAQGKVVDTAARPVAGAEVVVAAKSLTMPAHFGTVTRTGVDGVFSLSGLPAGQILVAARRGPGERWVVAGPHPVAGDVVIELPARHALTIDVRSNGGAPLADVEFKLTESPGETGPGLGLAMIGMADWIDVGSRIARTEDGRHRIAPLLAGSYCVAVRAAGHAPAKLDVRLAADTDLQVVLGPELRLAVQVVDAQDAPLRNAAVYAAGDSMLEIPFQVGRTGSDGLLEVRDCTPGALRLTASHPAYGMSHAAAAVPHDGPVVIRMPEPGSIAGEALDGGKPPSPGAWTMTLSRDWEQVQGALDTMPRFAVPDRAGKFAFRGLAPGKYQLGCTPGFASLGSPGAIYRFAYAAVAERDSEAVHVTAGTETRVAFEVTRRAGPDGPSARITGTVLLNGKPAAGMVIQGWSQQGRLFAEVDAAGRFDVGQVPVGQCHLELRSGRATTGDLQTLDGALWEDDGEVKAGEDRHCDISLDTGGMAGVVVRADGRPAAGARVVARGTIQAVSGGEAGASQSTVEVVADREGRFAFPILTAGSYSVEVEGGQGHARVEGLAVTAGAPLAGVRVELARVFTVRGTVDVGAFPENVQWVYLQLIGTTNHGASVDRKTGRFELEGVPKGTYTMQVHGWGEDVEERFGQGDGGSLVVAGDVEGCKVQPTFRGSTPAEGNEPDK